MKASNNCKRFSISSLSSAEPNILSFDVLIEPIYCYIKFIAAGVVVGLLTIVGVAGLIVYLIQRKKEIEEEGYAYAPLAVNDSGVTSNDDLRL